jgi:hypothetical protein
MWLPLRAYAFKVAPFRWTRLDAWQAAVGPPLHVGMSGELPHVVSAFGRSSGSTSPVAA